MISSVQLAGLWRQSAIGDERHDTEAMHRWPERVERQLSCNRYKAKSHCKSFDALAKLIKL